MTLHKYQKYCHCEEERSDDIAISQLMLFVTGSPARNASHSEAGGRRSLRSLAMIGLFMLSSAICVRSLKHILPYYIQQIFCFFLRNINRTTGIIISSKLTHWSRRRANQLACGSTRKKPIKKRSREYKIKKIKNIAP